MHTCFLTPSCSNSPYVMLNFRRERAGILSIKICLVGSFSCRFLKSRVLIMIIQLLNRSLFNLTLTVIDFVNIQTKKHLNVDPTCTTWLKDSLFMLDGVNALMLKFHSIQKLWTYLRRYYWHFLAVNIQILISTPLNFVLIFISMRYVKTRGGSRAQK